MLSMASRVTFTKFVLQGLLTYVMQSTLILTSICEAIDKKCCAFVWRDSDESKKNHIVASDKLCKPKITSGLRLRLARTTNKTKINDKRGENKIFFSSFVS
uniref:Ribonuclease H protein At1g65750 family n=1 Tax=Cajanus cajan TaxID=3821 RepID=A0A151RGT8_CAJCA|nr:Putative ribonuclease H protein At1g65750 family [Cajanus cajan]